MATTPAGPDGLAAVESGIAGPGPESGEPKPPPALGPPDDRLLRAAHLRLKRTGLGLGVRAKLRRMPKLRTTTDWDVSAEHHHLDGTHVPMEEIGIDFGEPMAAFPDLVADQARTFRCSCGETVTVDLTINLKRQIVPDD